MSDYVPVEYPKWVGGQIVNTPEEEFALLASLAPAPEPEPEPESDDADKRQRRGRSA